MSILNINLTESAYQQATLPIAYGGLGIRLATEVVLVGFLSSVCATSSTVQSLLPQNLSTQFTRMFCGIQPLTSGHNCLLKVQSQNLKFINLNGIK